MWFFFIRYLKDEIRMQIFKVLNTLQLFQSRKKYNKTSFQHFSFLKNRKIKIEYRKLFNSAHTISPPHGFSSFAWDLSLGDSGFGAASDVSSVEGTQRGIPRAHDTASVFAQHTHTETHRQKGVAVNCR